VPPQPQGTRALRDPFRKRVPPEAVAAVSTRAAAAVVVISTRACRSSAPNESPPERPVAVVPSAAAMTLSTRVACLRVQNESRPDEEESNDRLPSMGAVVPWAGTLSTRACLT